MDKLPEHVLDFLANIYNSCFKLKYFPKKQKKAVVILIQKPGKIKADNLVIIKSVFVITS